MAALAPPSPTASYRVDLRASGREKIERHPPIGEYTDNTDYDRWLKRETENGSYVMMRLRMDLML